MARRRSEGFGVASRSAGSGTPASAKPAARRTQLSQRPHGPVGPGIVAAVRQPVVEAERHAALDDVGLGQHLERRVDAEALAVHAPRRGERGQVLERRDELRTAVGIPGVVERVDADEDVVQRRGPRPSRARATERPCCARERRSTESPADRSADPSGTGASVVSDEPPNADRSTSSSMCRSTPSHRATARAASSSFAWR